MSFAAKRVNLNTITMKKNVFYEGIEFALPVYDTTAVSVMHYLERVVTRLQEGLDLRSGSFRLSLNVTFLPGAHPRHTIISNGRTPKAPIARLLSEPIAGNYDHVTGSVTVHLLVKDR